MWQTAKGSESCQGSCKRGVSCGWATQCGLARMGASHLLPGTNIPFSSFICVLASSGSVLSLSRGAMCLGGIRLSSGAIPWIFLSVSVFCLSVCLSSQASCVTALHPVSSAPVIIGHHQSWSPLTASPPTFCVTNHCPGAPALPPRTPACLPARPMAPGAQHWALGHEDSSGPARPPSRLPGVDAVVPVAAQPLAPPERRASGECLERPLKTWSPVVSRNC